VKEVLITAKAEYALRAVVWLAGAVDRRVKADSLAHETGIPRQALEDVMGELSVARIVQQQRGSAEGYQLAVEPSALDVATVLRAVGSSIDAERFGRGEELPALDVFWRALLGTARDVLERVTVGDLVADAIPEDLRRIAAVEARGAKPSG
jgi:Rrf2 family protein